MLGQLAVDLDQHVLGLLLDQRLGGEHVLDLRRADAVGQRPEGAVGGGVAVTADDGGARQREALLRAHHVDDALALVELVEILDAEFGSVLGQRLDLDAAFLFGDALGAVGGRHVVVDHGQRLLRVADLAAGHAQALEGLGARHFVDEVAVDVEQAGAVLCFMCQVIIPDLVIERARLGHRFCLRRSGFWGVFSGLQGDVKPRRSAHMAAMARPPGLAQCGQHLALPHRHGDQLLQPAEPRWHASPDPARRAGSDLARDLQ